MRPTTELMLITRALSWRIMERWNALMQLKTPLRLVSMTVSQSSSLMRKASPSRVTPALFTRMSTLPKASMIFLPTAAVASVSEISTANACAEPGWAVLISAVVDEQLLSERLTTATLAPSAAKREAMAFPIPRPPPVTTATLSSSLSHNAPSLSWGRKVCNRQKSRLDWPH